MTIHSFVPGVTTERKEIRKVKPEESKKAEVVQALDLLGMSLDKSATPSMVANVSHELELNVSNMSAKISLDGSMQVHMDFHFLVEVLAFIR